MTAQCAACNRPMASLRAGVLCSACEADLRDEVRRLSAMPPRERYTIGGVLRVAGLLLLAKVCEREV